MADSGYKCISRIDNAKKETYGWYVRVRCKGEMYAKFFSDSQYDTPQDALEAAVDWRDETEKLIGRPRTERRVLMVSPRNRSGRMGVRRRTIGAQAVYEVYWSPAPRCIQRTSVSIAKYGELEAFRRACEIRKEKERELFGAELPSPRLRRHGLTAYPPGPGKRGNDRAGRK